MDKSKLMCRTCKGTYEDLYSLLDCKNGAQTIMEMLITTTPELNIQADDGLPRHICGVCYKLLNIAYNFHQMCITSDKQLRADLEKANNQSIIIKQEHDGEVPICMETLENLPSIEGEYDPLVVNNEQIKLEDSEGVHGNRNDDILLECHAAISNTLCSVPDSRVENVKSHELATNSKIASLNLDESSANETVCQICSKTFKYNKNLFRHLRLFHIPKSVDNSAENKRYLEDFQNDKILQAHKRVERNDVREAVCQICSKSFKYHKNLYRHLRMFHIGKTGDEFNSEDCVDRNMKSKPTTTAIEVAEDSTEDKNKKELQNVPQPSAAKCDDLIIKNCADNTLENKNRTASDEILNDGAAVSKDNENKFQTNMLESSEDFDVTSENKSTAISENVLAEGWEDCKQEKKNASGEKVLQNVAQPTTVADYRDSAIWKAHKLKKEPNLKQAICEICSKVFKYRKNLYRHLRHTHQKTNKKPRDRVKKTYVCEYCNETFKNNTHLRRHRSKHTGEILFLCPYCGKTYSSEGSLKQHVMRHTGQKHFQCPECPSKFVSQRELSLHMTTHNKIFAHVCDICGAKFGRSYTLKMHKERHSGRRPYKCKQCDMTFVFTKCLNRHMLTHTGERPHKCKFCSRAYAAHADLNKHLRIHLGVNTYKCTQCPLAFKYRKELRDHEVQHFKEQKQREQQQEQESTITNIAVKSTEDVNLC